MLHYSRWRALALRTVGGRVVFNGTSTAANADFDIHVVVRMQTLVALWPMSAFTTTRTPSSAIRLSSKGDPDPLGNGNPGLVILNDQSDSAARATLIANKGPGSSGGNITFAESATGDNARVGLCAATALWLFSSLMVAPDDWLA